MKIRRFFSRRFRKKPYRRAAIVLAAILCISLILCAARLYDLAAPIALENAQTVARGKTEALIAGAVSRVIGSGEYDYSSFVIISRDTDGSINSVFVNSVNLAKVKADIVDEINDSLSQNSTLKISVPLGDVLSPRYLSGRGFGIDVTTVMYSSVAAQTSSSVSTAGINQTLHTISVDIEIQASIRCRGEAEELSIKSTQIIAQALNVGAVPDAFFDSFPA